jgi:hypothetical protein
MSYAQEMTSQTICAKKKEQKTERDFSNHMEWIFMLANIEFANEL